MKAIDALPDMIRVALNDRFGNSTASMRILREETDNLEDATLPCIVLRESTPGTFEVECRHKDENSAVAMVDCVWRHIDDEGRMEHGLHKPTTAEKKEGYYACCAMFRMAASV